jgi:acyl-CoA dehydrogenase family member 9
MGLRGNDLRRLYFNDVSIPPENVLGEPGEGFRIAMHVLNNGRMSLGTGSVGATKVFLDLIIDHVKERKQFDRPLADFELVQDKIGWMVSYLFGLEAMTYLTTGLVDRKVPDYSLESAIVKVAGTEFLWYAANRALQLKGGAGYMRDEPYEKALRDIRIFPIFEGANDVMRAFIALSGMKPLGDELKEVGAVELSDPIGSIGVLADYVSSRVKREVMPDRVTMAHDSISQLAEPLTDQVKRLRGVTESLLREHRKEIIERQLQQKRLADAVADIYAQIAVLSRVTAHLEEHDVEVSGQELYIAETFCTRAAKRVVSQLDQVEQNDDDRMVSIAKLALKRGQYGYAFFDD